MRHQPPTRSGTTVPPEARAVLPDIADSHRNALEQLSNAFTEFRPLALLISEEGTAASSVIRNFLDRIEGDVTVARVTAANSNAIAGMREIIRSIGFDPKNMSVGEMEHVFTMFLSFQKAHDLRTIICFDEAPDDGQWVLDRVQHLVKLETDGKYGLMVVLSGRSCLNELLEKHRENALVADVAERITLSHKLSRGVPGAAKRLYAKYFRLANKDESAAVTTGVVNEEAKQPHQQPHQGQITQLSEVPSGTMNGNGSNPAIGRLIVHMNGEIIQAQVLKKDHILIGRSRMCDLRLVPHEVSLQHAIVVNSSNGTDLVDLRSKNGTFVNGHSIKRYPLRDNDAISIGGCMIRYIADDTKPYRR